MPSRCNVRSRAFIFFRLLPCFSRRLCHCCCSYFVKSINLTNDAGSSLILVDSVAERFSIAMTRLDKLIWGGVESGLGYYSCIVWVPVSGFCNYLYRSSIYRQIQIAFPESLVDSVVCELSIVEVK
ncbi:hypothetical protein GGR50DRAFT_561124 [Xylaria sp. CBS 124048]|nr:hypothetical protein GGR50DRAFT_561124 [Xylaria sp. CBS 124048]